MDIKWGIVGIAALLLGTYMVVQYKQNLSLANFAWGMGVGFIALYTLIARGTYHPRQVIVTALICFWSGRLLIFLIQRFMKLPEPRYEDWKTNWGMFGIIKGLIWVFVVQLIGMLIMASPNYIINVYSEAGISYLDVIASALWLFGFCYELIADHQLYEFRIDPKNTGKIMNNGLWATSRHPNYFGEQMMWWAMWLFALSVPYGAYTIIAPLFELMVFLFFSIPKVESIFKNNEAYQEYKKKTPVLVPWPFKKENI